MVLGPNLAYGMRTHTLVYKNGSTRGSKVNICCSSRQRVMAASTTSAAGQKLSRDDWRKRKELEEARKAGTAPAEVDEEGR